MFRVEEEHIKNEQIREMFFNIPSPEVLIDCRTMKLLGDIVRAKASIDLPSRHLLIAFCKETRPVGRSLKSCKELLLASLFRLLKPIGMYIDNKGSLKDWYMEALDKNFWDAYIAYMRDQSNPRPNPPNRFRYEPPRPPPNRPLQQ